MVIWFANEILLSNRFPSIRQRFFNMPKAHSTATLAADKALLKAISSGSLVVSRMAFEAKKLEGMHCLQLERV